MALKKCPKCELNYIKADQDYCDVCKRQMNTRGKNTSKDPEEEIICSECGEAPAVPGHDLCFDCMMEQKRQKELEFGSDDEDFDDSEDDQDDEEE